MHHTNRKSSQSPVSEPSNTNANNNNNNSEDEAEEPEKSADKANNNKAAASAATDVMSSLAASLALPNAINQDEDGQRQHLSSLYGIIGNIQTLLKVAVENAKQEERQILSQKGNTIVCLTFTILSHLVMG